MTIVRRLRPRERDVALDAVLESFRADPQLRWYFPDDAAYEAGARTFFGVLLDTRIEGGEVWVAGDRGLDALALWVPPGGNLLGPDAVERRYEAAMASLPARAAERIALADALVDGLLPRTPHWYLGVLACRPDRRRRGRASAVIRPILDAADRAGLPVALETASAANVDFYLRRGFAVVGSGRPGVAQGAADGANGVADGADGGGPPVVRVMSRSPWR